MKNTGIFYGSSTGVAEELAGQIASRLGIASSDVYDVASADPSAVDKYDVLLMGTSSFGDGDMQDAWYPFVDKIKGKITGKTVVLFGVGDSDSYGDTFCNGMSELHDSLKDSGCKFCGAYDASGYNYSSSKSVVDGKFIGLAADQVNEPEKTPERMEKWIAAFQGCI